MLNDFLFIGTFRIRESFLASILKDPYFFAGIFFASSFGIGIWCCVAAFFCYSLLRRSSVKREFGNSGGITSSPFGIPMRSVCITSKERRRRHPSCFESCFSNRWSKKGRVKASQEFWLKGNRYNHWSRGKWRMEIAKKGSWSYKSESQLRRSLCLQFLFILENWAFQSSSRSENTFWEKISIFWENPCFPRWLACLV